MPKTRSGRSRGRKAPQAKYSRSKGYKPWITRKGKLGGPGFLNKSPIVQKKLLDRCVNTFGYRSCLGSVMVLNRSRYIRDKHGVKLDKLKSYLKTKYGGKGSFKSKRKIPKKVPKNFMRSCKKNQIRDQKSGKCKSRKRPYKVKRTTMKKPCPKAKVRSRKTGRCVYK